MMLGASEIRSVLDRHGLSPSRALGQNFVHDPNTIERIVRLAGVDAGDRVLEIGPGLGSLTLGLVAAGAMVTAVELDRHLVPALQEVLERGGAADAVTIVVGDAMEVDWPAVLDRDDGPWTLVANLPYNVAAPVVLRLLDEAPQVHSMLVMVQREVGERLVAPVGGADYGIPSVKVAYWATGRIAGRVPRTVFHPVPNVDSVLVRIDRRSEPATTAPAPVLFELVRTAFGQRRKMVRRSLAARVDEECYAVAGVAPTARPQELGVADWGRLADALATRDRDPSPS